MLLDPTVDHTPSTTAVAVGTGTYFNRSPDKLREVQGAQLKNVRTVKGDPKAGTEDVAVNTPIATILSDGEDASAIPAATAPNVRRLLGARPSATARGAQAWGLGPVTYTML